MPALVFVHLSEREEILVKGQGFTKKERDCLSRLGKRIDAQIKAKGYVSAYEFWLEHGEGNFSRSNLNYMLNGRTDLRVTTLLKISSLLGLKINDFFNEEN